MNEKEKAFYDRQMRELLKDDMDIYGNVPKDKWKIADRIVRNLIRTMSANGLFR